jgi:hypothetical protein
VVKHVGVPGRLVNPVLALLAVCVPIAGCRGWFGPDCKDETRTVIASVRLTSMLASPLPDDTGRASLNLHEARDAVTKSNTARDIMWFAGSGLDRSRVTAIHVHELDTNRLLFTMPIDSAFGPRYVITQVFTRQPYTGSVRFSEFYELVGNEKTYVDVHTIDYPDGQLRGVLRPEYPNWRNFVHHYCS